MGAPQDETPGEAEENFGPETGPEQGATGPEVEPEAGPQPGDEGETPAEMSATKDERTMAMLAHLLGIVSGFLGALIIWLIKREESEFVDDQGKEALNFQITLLIAYLVCFGPLNLLFCIGSILGMAVWVAAVVFCIMAGTSANKGELYRYPVNIRFIK